MGATEVGPRKGRITPRDIDPDRNLTIIGEIGNNGPDVILLITLALKEENGYQSSPSCQKPHRCQSAHLETMMKMNGSKLRTTKRPK